MSLNAALMVLLVVSAVVAVLAVLMYRESSRTIAELQSLLSWAHHQRDTAQKAAIAASASSAAWQRKLQDQHDVARVWMSS